MSIREIHTKLMILVFIMVGFAIYIQIRYQPFSKIVSLNTDSTQNEVENNGDNQSGGNRINVTVTNSNGDELIIESEQAQTPEERAQGLMYREDLKENAGMLFIFRHDTTGSFWMKNCKIALDMIFMNQNGEITYIEHSASPCSETINKSVTKQENNPSNEANQCPLYGNKKPYRYVLEVNGGWCKSHEVNIGNMVKWSNLKKIN